MAAHAIFLLLACQVSSSQAADWQAKPSAEELLLHAEAAEEAGNELQSSPFVPVPLSMLELAEQRGQDDALRFDITKHVSS